MNPRDTQFMGFAKALYEELARHTIESTAYTIDDCTQEQYRIIARRAYDLIEHACEAIEDKQWDYESRLSSWHMLTSIPDMPVLPEEKN